MLWHPTNPVVVLVIVLVVVGLSFLYLMVKMILEFGGTTAKEVLEAAIKMYHTLRYEPRKTHPSIRLEFRFHQFFGAVLILCFVGLIVHSLIPWASKVFEYAASVGFITSLLFVIFLAIKSIDLSARLP